MIYEIGQMNKNRSKYAGLVWIEINNEGWLDLF